MLPFGGGESRIHHPLQESPHIVVEAVEIIENARLGQLSEADFRHDLADLLQSARAAGKGDERIAKLDHARATLGDVRHYDQFGQSRVRDTSVREHLCLYAGYFAAVGQHGIGDIRHQPLVGSAVHQTVAAVRDPCAQFLNGFLVGRIIAFMRAEIHGDVHVSSLPVGMS